MLIVIVETFAQLYLVMLNLFQHLIISVSYETLKQVQGDNYGIMQRSLFSIKNQDSEKGFRYPEFTGNALFTDFVLFVGKHH